MCFAVSLLLSLFDVSVFCHNNNTTVMRNHTIMDVTVEVKKAVERDGKGGIVGAVRGGCVVVMMAVLWWL